MTFGWLDIDDIAEALDLAHSAVNPYALRFTELRRLVEALPGFKADPDHPVNEKILETIQAAWIELRTDGPASDDDDDD